MGYCDNKGPDSRIESIRKSSEQAVPMADPAICDECKGFGEIAVVDEEGKLISRAPCQKCEGTGAVL